MKRAIKLSFAACILASWPAIAQATGDIPGSSASTNFQAYGPIGVCCSLLVILYGAEIFNSRKDRAKAAADLAEKDQAVLAVSLAHAADSAKTIALMERLVKFMEKGGAS